MRLTDEGLKDRQVWLDHGYTLPQYDRGRMRQATLATPRWIHFGAGNIFRAYQTRLMQKLIEAGEVSEGLIAAEGYDDEVVDGMLNPHDDLNILVTLKASGSVEKTVIGSLAGRIKGYHLHNNNGTDDSHRRIRDGVIDYDRFFRLYRAYTPSADLTLEYGDNHGITAGDVQRDVEDVLKHVLGDSPAK